MTPPGNAPADPEEEWRVLAEWWIEDGSRDPLYPTLVLPLLRDLVGTDPGAVLDLGCGEGQAMRYLEADVAVLGCDVTPRLLAEAATAGPVVRSRLPRLRWLRDEAIAGAYAVFVLEHLPDADAVFVETARVVRDGGFLVVIANHPAYTAPGAGPLIDERDGEVLWRWGPYFSEAVAAEPVGPGTATFHHRTLGALLNAAAAAGWVLERIEERAVPSDHVDRHPSLAGQEHMPRVIGLRWSRAARRPGAVQAPRARGR